MILVQMITCSNETCSTETCSNETCSTETCSNDSDPFLIHASTVECIKNMDFLIQLDKLCI